MVKFLKSFLVFLSLSSGVNAKFQQSDVAFDFLEKNPSQRLVSTLKYVFITAFEDRYKNFKPEQIKAHFRTRKDIHDWLSETFDDEFKEFQQKKEGHLLAIKNKKDDVLLGVCFFRELPGNALHMRQVAVLPYYQRQGVGTLILDAIKRRHPNAKKMFADSRKNNTPTILFYQNKGFKLAPKPFDAELDPKRYAGLTWIKK